MPSYSDQPLLSILIPHHGREIDNISILLGDLDSSLQKKLSIEIVACLNQGYELNSDQLCDVRTITTPLPTTTGGEKRNFLLEASNGKFIWFLDADDVLYTDTLTRLCANLSRNETDVVLTNFTTVNSRGEIVDVSRLPLGVDKTKEYKFLQLCEEQPTSGVLHLDKIMPWSNAVYRQIISRDYILRNKLHFSSKLIGEDHEFSLDLLALNPTISFFSSITYQHILHSGSITNSHSKFLFKEFITSLIQIEEKISHLPKSAFKSAVDNYYKDIVHIAPYCKFNTLTKDSISLLGFRRSIELFHFKIYGKAKFETNKILRRSKLNYLSKIFKRIIQIWQRIWRSNAVYVGAQLSGFHPMGPGAASQRIIAGENVLCSTNISFETGLGFLEIGDNSSIGSGTIIITQEQGISIGKNCLISWNVLITDSDTHLTDPSRISDARDWNIGHRTGRRGEYKEWVGIRSAPVSIGDNVWIGYGSVILPGVTIGNNAIIGASSVVTKNVPAGATVAGNPAKIISESK
jgi:acetyltransferase-like isoleucine patch superfamily enzyme